MGDKLSAGAVVGAPGGEESERSNAGEGCGCYEDRGTSRPRNRLRLPLPLSPLRSRTGPDKQESAWNPWAIRFEPLFFAKYVASLYTNNKVSASEAYARGFSWGLMQVNRLQGPAQETRRRSRRHHARPASLERRSQPRLPSPSPSPQASLFVAETLWSAAFSPPAFTD